MVGIKEIIPTIFVEKMKKEAKNMSKVRTSCLYFRWKVSEGKSQSFTLLATQRK